MFYTETITIPVRSPSFLERVIKIFEKIGKARAAAELTRMGYTEEAKKIMLEQ